jgi:hypothetical protein
VLPLGREVVVITGLEFTVRPNPCESVSPLASRTVTEKRKAPRLVGVPVIAPAPLRESPAGRDPEAIDHTYGALPPETVSVCEYATVTVAGGRVLVMIFGAPWAKRCPATTSPAITKI